MYGAPHAAKSFNLHRFNALKKSVSNMKPDLSFLPPMEGAAMQHTYQIFHQIQLLQGNELFVEICGGKRKLDYA